MKEDRRELYPLFILLAAVIVVVVGIVVGEHNRGWGRRESDSPAPLVEMCHIDVSRLVFGEEAFIESQECPGIVLWRQGVG